MASSANVTDSSGVAGNRMLASAIRNVLIRYSDFISVRDAPTLIENACASGVNILYVSVCSSTRYAQGRSRKSRYHGFRCGTFRIEIQTAQPIYPVELDALN